MERAAANAEQSMPEWRAQAFEFLVDFAGANIEFISEDVSDASKEKGFPQPPTDRAWGTVYVKAVKAGIITQYGIGRSRRRHASICPLWRSLVFKAA